MQQYKKDFIEFLVQCGVLTFGDFTTKSGRKTPYFVNTGRYRMGSHLAQLGKFYAQAIREQIGSDFDNLYGPAYKGISLAVTTSVALSQDFDQDISVTFNRKEAKDHGEKGILIGHQFDGTEKLVIIEDVITAGTSIRETMSILASNNSPKVSAVIVSVDRMERGQGQLTAMDEVKEEFGFNVYSIVNVKEIIDYLHNKPVNGQVVLDDDCRNRMEAYLKEYGC